MEYTLSKIAEITAGKLHGQNTMVRSVTTDSRNHTSEDSMFVALRGLTRDGHDYIRYMAQRGVYSFLVERIPQLDTEDYHLNFVVVDDSLDALQKLAAYHRDQFTGEVVAITGSNGKTVIKEWFAQLWDPANGKLLRSPRSYNSQLGVALSLLLIEGDERLVVIEAGISEVGEMERLERMIRPTIGVFTNIGDAHLKNFSSEEELLHEKERLFTNVDRVIRADHSIVDIDEQNRELVLRIYRGLGLSHLDVSELQPIAMRLELKEGLYGSTIINDSYNNDLVSLGIALDYQNRLQNRNKALVFSDFGGSYEKVAELVENHDIDLFIGIGQQIGQMKNLFKSNSLFFTDTDTFISRFDPRTISGYSVLLKGSRSFAFEQISHLLENRTHTTVMEIDLDAMASNLNHYRSLLNKGCKIMAMVKAHSYGTGSVEVATMLQHQGVDYLAVAFVDEGVALRRGGIEMPIVVLNSDPHSFHMMIENQLEPEIYSFSSLYNFIATAKQHGVSRYPIHLKLDTGMHRLGFVENEIGELNDILNNQNVVNAASVFSHFAASDDPSEDDFTRLQIKRFESMSQSLPRAIRHICNTSGITRFGEAHFDMVRLGIGLYIGDDVVCRLKTRIVQIKDIPAGDSIGYGRHGKAEKATRIATIPIGYADGLNRHLSRGIGFVSVHNTLCPIIGNICMDTCMVDVTNVPQAQENDEVTIFGDNPTVNDLALWLDTIPYEILTSISSRIKKIYING